MSCCATCNAATQTKELLADYFSVTQYDMCMLSAAVP